MSKRTQPKPPMTRSHSTPTPPSANTPGAHDHQLLLDSPTHTITPSSITTTQSPDYTKSIGGTSGKMLAIKVLLLDDTVTIIQAQSKTAPGRLIFTQICKQLNILESDYFGLEYTDPSTGFTYWLDLDKRLSRQVAFHEPFLKFSVKFYTPDPSQLEEEFTRYLFSLQIKRDLANGVLSCNDNTGALMASFIVQAECGDFSEEDYPDSSYLSHFKFVPHQNGELERKIRECHKKHVGQSPAEADLHLLETARRTEMYGIRVVPGRDEDGVPLQLSVCHNGVVVFQNGIKINTFSWAKIRKISFKRKRFILKLHPESYGYYKELVEFIFDSRNECKAFWKRCVEHHAFFRCEKAPNPVHRSKKGILSSRGSSFRYSGRTQKQMVQFVRENFVKRPPTSQSQYLSQQNLASFDAGQQNHGVQQGRNNNDLLQRSSSFKSGGSAPQQQQHHHSSGGGGGSGGLLTRRSMGDLINNGGSQQRGDYSNGGSGRGRGGNNSNQDNHHEDEDDDGDDREEEEEEEFSDYNLEDPPPPPRQQQPQPQQPPKHHSHRPHLLQQQQSLPDRVEPHYASTTIEGNNNNNNLSPLATLEQKLLQKLINNSSHNSSSPTSSSSSSSSSLLQTNTHSTITNIPMVKTFSSQNEFPVTNYKTQVKIKETAVKETVTKEKKKKLKKIRSKSLVKVKDSDDEYEEASLSKSSTLPRDGIKSGNHGKNSRKDDYLSSHQGSYDILEGQRSPSKITFQEIEIPYLLRRRIDLDNNNENNKKLLSKSKSYGGQSGLEITSGKKIHKKNINRLVSYCSMVDLPPVNSFSWRDDSLDTNDVIIIGGSGGDLRHANSDGVIVKNVEELEIVSNVAKEAILEEIKEESTSSSNGLNKVANELVKNVIETAEKESNNNKQLLRKDSFQKMQSLDGIEDIPMDTKDGYISDEDLKISVKDIINEIIDEENDENLSEKDNTISPSGGSDLNKVESDNVNTSLPPPPPPVIEDDDGEYGNIETPRFPPPSDNNSSGSRRSSYEIIGDCTPASTTLKKALMRSFSIAEETNLDDEEDFDLPYPVDPPYDHVPSANPPVIPPHRGSLNQIAEEPIEYIDDPLYDTVNPCPSNKQESIEEETEESSEPVIFYKTRFRTLSRISERSKTSQSSMTQEGQIKESQTLDAPLVTLTSELGDSSATLNDLEEIAEDLIDDGCHGEEDDGEGEFYVEGVYLEKVRECQVVAVGGDKGGDVGGIYDSGDDSGGGQEGGESGEDEDSTTSECRQDTVKRIKRVCIELRVVGGEIVDGGGDKGGDLEI